MRYLYSLLLYLALPFIFLRLLWRSREIPDYRRRWRERLGFSPHHLKNCIWIHAVSVGETIAALPLIKALKIQYPHLPLLVTNMTPTGYARVKAALGDSVLSAYIPYDLPDAMERFLERISPLVCVVMETELWPNLFALCYKRDIRIIVTNARLSEKSARGYQRIASLTRAMLSAIDVLAAQSQADADRFIALGMSSERVKVTGNLKFDLEIPSDLLVKSTVLRRQLGSHGLIWIAASTHPEEEMMMLAAHQLILKSIPDALLILVPRHPERFDEVATLALQQGFRVQRRSQSSPFDSTVNVYLGDTMGELLLLYAVSDVACVAGSFMPIGGHNMIEPAALHKPVISGPQLFNFSDISELLLTAQGLIIVQNAEQLAETVIEFFKDEHYRKRIGENAYHVVERNRGALQRQLSLIKLSA